MEKLLETIVTNIVDNPEEVSINKVEGSKSIILELNVVDEDMGKVIGKKGRIAKAIRTVLKAAASKKEKRVILEIIE